MHMREFKISSKDWGDILISRPVTDKNNIWGWLKPLEGTIWGGLIPVVSGENMSHALNGMAIPLMKEIGPEPIYLLKKVSHMSCALLGECLTADPKVCFPHNKMLDCYMPDKDFSIGPMAAYVALAWKEGRYVVLVEGAEFS